MSLTLQKGGNLSLTKVAPSLSRLAVCLGWEERSTAGDDFDLDASALGLNGNHKVISDDWFVFYNQLTSPGEVIRHTGDNLTGEGEGDAEVIIVNLRALPHMVQSIVFPVSIYEADKRRQNFGMVRDAYIRVVDLGIREDQDDPAHGIELARYDLTEDFGGETAMVFGEVYRYNGEWKFRAIGQGYNSGLHGIATDFGVKLT